jgi:predicted N-formylglutamate amidohydrolase
MIEFSPPPNTDAPPDPLLSAEDPPPVRVIGTGGAAPVLVVCDHAGNLVPAGLGTLGLDPAYLGQHIGWDIGAAAVSIELARLLGAEAVLSAYSRLVVDCNRALDDPTLIPAISDGVEVPGNQALDDSARRSRVAALHTPYHVVIGAHLDRFGRRGIVPAILSIHSFTPRMNGFDRPWQVGILWDRDPRIAVPLMRGLAAEAGLIVGDNQPYSARSPQGFTMAVHSEKRGLPHVLIELRQDEIASEAGALHYARILADVLAPILADQSLYRREFFG